MGFTTGFTGGVTLTLGVAYLTVLTHQRNRQVQCDALRVNTGVLRALARSDPVSAARLAAAPAAVPDLSTPLPSLSYPTEPEQSRLRPRSSFVDELKDRWNAEVAGAVRWVQTTDWVEVREDAETAASNIWSRVAGSSNAHAARDKVAEVADAVKTEAKTVQAGVAGAVTAATRAVERGASKTKEALAVDTSKLVNTAQTAGKTSDVEVALQQRYEKPDSTVMKKSVNDLLEERYKQKN
ncbi:hypothetical protein CMQ_5503 [Grosmannia clavigera kw1407]|uniref:MICOS complex subunit MIC12 n=1 Tax=Grosmannia clavigera (strain kw1407 / UAMH 11150) TaxID=655863 RepID=F0XSL4_GROCL|nr:uncharacterized protein CMQ_5503 [Grosmannia clavigera kw1407]EFW99082.1 hypothetical protein CMQ_5503 [Grosmannia clavigera kw1407]